MNAGVGPSYFSGLVGNAIINAPLWKLYGTASLDDGDPLNMKITFLTVDSTVGIGNGKSIPLAVDVVTWGQSDDGVNSGDRHNNAIYRLQAEESGHNNSSTFVCRS